MAAALARNGLIGPRGYASDSGGDPGAEIATKRHLYVVLDDCRTGYGIHKLDMDDDTLDGAGGARSLRYSAWRFRPSEILRSSPPWAAASWP